MVKTSNIIFLCCAMLGMIASCTTYTEGIDTYDVSVQLMADTQKGSGIEVQLRNSLGTVFTDTTDASGMAHFTLPVGIYQASASKVMDDDYVRTIYNGNITDLVVEGTTTKTMTVTANVLSLRNPLLIKELYIGGCQKDDGSGTFAFDKCIILYNNSSVAVSLDSVAIGMIEPYNAEAGSHKFMSNGVLQYADADWIPAINGIWYFQDGQKIQPYSELVVNVCGAIDNTLTYSNSVNYANADYYCMYDPSYIGSDGKAYANTNYYPSPAEVIPTSHYLKTVKYGMGNAWPLSTTSPAVILFKTKGAAPKEYAENSSNLIFPSDQQNNLVYACLKVNRSWVLDAVEVFNELNSGNCKKRLTPDLDNGYVLHTNAHGNALVRKVEKIINGHSVYLDTNNSTCDFYEADRCSLK